MIQRAHRFFLRTVDALRRRTLNDEFLRWLGYANAGMLDPGNVWSMDYAIRNLPSGHAIIEIGSFAGLSTNAICHLLRRHGRDNPVFSCDNWDVTGQRRTGCIGSSDLEFEQYADFVKASFIRNVEFFSPRNRPFTVASGSAEFFDLWHQGAEVHDVFGRAVRLGGPISFAYVDGIHSREAVRREFESIHAGMERGGFILFDDSADSSPFGLNRVMREIGRRSDYEKVRQNPNYLFRKR